MFKIKVLLLTATLNKYKNLNNKLQLNGFFYMLLIDLLLASTTQEKPILCDDVTNIPKNISHILC